MARGRREEVDSVKGAVCGEGKVTCFVALSSEYCGRNGTGDYRQCQVCSRSVEEGQMTLV